MYHQVCGVNHNECWALIYVVMKTEEISFKKMTESTKKRKSYFERLLELQLRKTNADRRREIFGIDPLSVQ